jgi:WD40 repeat protein
MPEDEEPKNEGENEDNELDENQPDDDDNVGEGAGEGDDPNEAEGEGEEVVFVEKEFVAQPYESKFKDATLQEVTESNIINTRKPLKVRISKKRSEFHSEGYNLTDRDAGDGGIDARKKITALIQNKMVLDIGLQAAKPIKTFSSQTYHNRSVNFNVEYNPNDFMKENSGAENQSEEIINKLQGFFEKVAPRIEEALQSNELINVFQDDFEMLGDKEKNTSTKIANQASEPLPFSDIDHGKNKSVSCIAFHPTMPHRVALSFLENISFDERAEISGKSYDSSVLVLNFADNHIMLSYVLHTTIEVNTIEFHPDHPNILFGGCLSGQIIAWDFQDESLKVISEDDNLAGADEEGEKKKEGEDEVQDKSTQSVTEMKSACISMVAYSHKTHVNDIKFVPRSVKVDKKRPSEGEITHFVSCAEDGNIMIWDSRVVFKENRKVNAEEMHWKPYLSIPLYKLDGTGEQGLSKILFNHHSSLPHFWAGSDEGDLIFVDWSKRPTGKEEDQAKKSDFMLARECQRNYRRVLALEQSPFFEDLIMTVHDFNFCIWNVSLEDYQDPIFTSSYTFGSYNTCGVFSPTRAGVIFISKTNGIDVWDFLDQSHKASMSLGSVSSVITFITFQQYKHNDGSQYLAFGEQNDGTVFLYNVPPNLRTPQGEEKTMMDDFWKREIKK